MNARTRISIAAVALLLLSGCIPNAIVRTERANKPHICAGSVHECSKETWQFIPNDLTNESDDVQLGFIEFDDQGALRSRELKKDVIENVRAMAAKTPILVVLFAHGWKHNAKADDSNVVDFASMLARIAKEDQTACLNNACLGRKVIGIYVGWRGLSASVEPFKEMSFWTRKSRAERVGLDGAMEVIADLKKLDAGNANNKLILIGHSFGGALIYTAVQQQLMRDTAFLKSGSVAREAADLIVLVNPAFEASRFDALNSRVAEMSHSRTQKPILAVFTSRGDTATAKAFPVGRTLGTLFQSHVSDKQKKKNRTAVGHYDDFITHDLEPISKDSAQRGNFGLSSYPEYGCSWQAYQDGSSDSWSLNELSLTRRKEMQTEGQRRNPYYNVSVDESLINGHNGIWGLRFSQFLYRFIAVQSWRESDKC